MDLHDLITVFLQFAARKRTLSIIFQFFTIIFQRVLLRSRVFSSDSKISFIEMWKIGGILSRACPMRCMQIRFLLLHSVDFMLLLLLTCAMIYYVIYRERMTRHTTSWILIKIISSLLYMHKTRTTSSFSNILNEIINRWFIAYWKSDLFSNSFDCVIL